MVASCWNLEGYSGPSGSGESWFEPRRGTCPFSRKSFVELQPDRRWSAIHHRRKPLDSASANAAGSPSAVTAAAGGFLYVIGGLDAAGTAQRSVFRFSSTANTWTTVAQLPSARYGGAAAAISGQIYVAGGLDATGKATATLYAYNPATNTWASRAAMPAPSGCGGGAAIGGKLYVFSGCTLLSGGTSTAAALLHRYDPATNTWVKRSAAPETHFSPAVATMGGLLYVAGGNGSSGAQTRRLDVYYPSTDTWTTRAQMPSARVAAAAAGIQNVLYVVGGQTERRTCPPSMRITLRATRGG